MSDHRAAQDIICCARSPCRAGGFAEEPFLSGHADYARHAAISKARAGLKACQCRNNQILCNAVRVNCLCLHMFQMFCSLGHEKTILRPRCIGLLLKKLYLAGRR